MQMLDLEKGPLKQTTYHRDRSGRLAKRIEEYEPTYNDNVWMDLALDLAERAGENGDNAVGSVLVLPIDRSIGLERVFGAETREFRDQNLLGHAEILNYIHAQPYVGRDLSEARLYCSAEPCYQCAGLYDTAKLGMLIVAAAKIDAPNFFRKPNTLDHIWSTTRRELVVVEGLKKARAIEILTKFNKKH